MPRTININIPNSAPPFIDVKGKRVGLTDYFRLDRLRLTQEAVDTGLRERRFAYYYDPNLSPFSNSFQSALDSQKAGSEEIRKSIAGYLTPTRVYGTTEDRNLIAKGFGVVPEKRAEIDSRSYSGADFTAYLVMPGYTTDALNAGVRKLGELQTISISTMRTLTPVRRLGEISARSYSRGRRTISGTLVFALINRDVFANYLTAADHTYIETEFENRPSHFDRIPPFHIILDGVSELPANEKVTDISSGNSELRSNILSLNQKLDTINIQLSLIQSELPVLQLAQETAIADLENFAKTIKPIKGFSVPEYNIESTLKNWAAAINDSKHPFITDGEYVKRKDGYVWDATWRKIYYDMTSWNGTEWVNPDEATVTANTAALIVSGEEDIPRLSDINSGLGLYEDFYNQVKSEFSTYTSDYHSKNEALYGYEYWNRAAKDVTSNANAFNRNKATADETIAQLPNTDTSQRADELILAADPARAIEKIADWELSKVNQATISFKLQEAATILQTAETIGKTDPNAAEKYKIDYYYGADQRWKAYNERNGTLNTERADLTDSLRKLTDQYAKSAGPSATTSANIARTTMVLYNVHLFASGITVSVHDIYTEVMYQYVAEYMAPFKDNESAQRSFKYPMANHNTSALTLKVADSVLNRKLTSDA